MVITQVLTALLLLSYIISSSKFERDVDSLSIHFRDYAKNSIGIDALQDRFYNLTSSEDIIIDAETKLNRIVNNIQQRTDIMKKILSDLRTFIEKYYKDNPEGDTSRGLKDCCIYNDVHWNNMFQEEVNMNDFCEMSRYNQSYCPSAKVKKMSVRLLDSENALKQLKQAYQSSLGHFIYFGGEDGYMIQYPAARNSKPSVCHCAQYDPRYRPWYVGTATPKGGKDVVLAIDVTKKFQNVKMKKILTDLVDLLMDSLGDRDRILVSFYGGGKRYGDLDCMKKLTTTKPALFNAIRDVVKNHTYTGDGISYSKVIEESYNALQGEFGRAQMIYFITSGYYVDKSDTIIVKTKEKSAATNCSVVMKMMTITEGSLTSERQSVHREILRMVCSCAHCTPTIKARNRLFLFDSQIENMDKLYLRSTVGNIFSASYNDENSDIIQYTLPYADFMGLGTLIDACTRCMDDKEKLLGVACASFMGTELLGVTTEQSDDSYVFLIDVYGRTYIHPKIADPVFTSGKALPLNIQLFETSDEFYDVYVSMLDGKNGNKTLVSKSSASLGDGRATYVGIKKTYMWKKIRNSPFSIALVMSEGYKELSFNISGQRNLKKEKYHRLDIYNETENLCLVKDKPALVNTSVVKLARDLFGKRNTYYKNETLESVDRLMTFLSMQSQQPPPEFISPDVAYKVREAVVATSFVEEEIWKPADAPGDLYTIWRYVGTEEGLFRVFPGTKMDAFYDPRIRPWYIAAMAFPNLLVFTTPYKDFITGKLVISMAKTLFKKHGRTMRVAGVGSLDFSILYLRGLLISLVTDCDSVFGYKCMLVDLFGYLVYHPYMVETTERSEETHLIEKEPHVAKHMIKGMLMNKTYAVGFFNRGDEIASGHLEYFYRIKQLRKSQTFADNCLKYTISPVKETNVLLIKVIKNDCAPTNCPCPQPPRKTCTSSKIHNLQTCECPCYDYKVCVEDLPSTKITLTSTPPYRSERANTNEKPWLPKHIRATLHDCMDPKCNFTRDHIDCNRLGCEWCYKYPNGTHFPDTAKFCSYYGKCFAPKSTSRSTLSPLVHTTETSITQKPVGTTAQRLSEGLSETEIIITVVFVVLLVLLMLALIIFFYKLRFKPPPKTPVEGYDNPAVVGDNPSGSNTVEEGIPSGSNLPNPEVETVSTWM